MGMKKEGEEGKWYKNPGNIEEIFKNIDLAQETADPPWHAHSGSIPGCRLLV